MSYTVSMHAEKIDCKIPLDDLPFLVKEFQDIRISHGKDWSRLDVELDFRWEEDSEPLRGFITYDKGSSIGNCIVLRDKQSGSFKNSSDGGLEMLLERYGGSGVVKTVGEEGDDTEVVKYEKGKAKKGKMVFI